ncbi:membrane protein [Legionella birminghamensis]|uniref:Membrane protein n=1 Tax=Legionella birminghamensis TaxID=28083 RepID=A0A378IB14_9GAMM|nr:hypothetical protein [Legionella birminghamensis]KTC69408.1 membrane protein [Legionella birminghamensis]STX31980.1 membrane protein [Legionella birminghamensis]
MNKLLHKQGKLLLENKSLAYFLTAALPFLPFASWLSLVIVALITLRQGARNGAGLLLTSIIASLLAGNSSDSASYITITILLTHFMCFAAALVLRASASWQWVAATALVISLLVVALTYGLVPNYIINEYNYILLIFSKLNPNNLLENLTKENQANVPLFASYCFGVKEACIVIFALIPLMFARYIQSLLFYPGGFRHELMAFRASRLVVGLFIITVAGVYQNNLLAISCLPVLSVYLMMAGLCLSFSLTPKRGGAFCIALLLLPLIIRPDLMLRVYILFGSLDSMFNFRLRLASKASNSKGV